MPRLQPPEIIEKDGQGRFLPGAELWFYGFGTNDPNPPYSDNELTSRLSNPVKADEYGVFPDIFLDDAQYEVELRTEDGELIWRKTTPTYLSLSTERVGAMRGVVWLFSGTQGQLDALIGEGWKVADGTGGTPDLTGYSRCETDPVNLPASGGNATQTPTGTITAHTLTEGELPEHNHFTNDLSGTPTYDFSPTYSGAGAGSIGTTGSTIQIYNRTMNTNQGGGGSHNHTTDFDPVTIEPSYIVVTPIIFGY